MRTFWTAVSCVNGGRGGRAMALTLRRRSPFSEPATSVGFGAVQAFVGLVDQVIDIARWAGCVAGAHADVQSAGDVPPAKSGSAALPNVAMECGRGRFRAMLPAERRRNLLGNRQKTSPGVLRADVGPIGGGRVGPVRQGGDDALVDGDAEARRVAEDERTVCDVHVE